ncbi:MAG: hypothetical protein HY859_07815 [Caulobacterales bacterium]|nr:hypothetical protein [Caulobacterales bacterium]
MRIVIATLAIAAVTLGACGKKEDSGKPTVTATADGYTVRSQDGSATVTAGAGAAAAANLPAFAQVYPGGQIQSSAAGIGDAKTNGGMVVFTTADAPDKVLAFYRSQAQASGLKSQLDADMGAARQFAANDEATGRVLQVIVSGQDGASQVQLIWGQKRP